MQPANPVAVNIIGAGGTGSQVIIAIARIYHALIALGHPGLFIRLCDDDMITDGNPGRQLFCKADTGRKKSAVLSNRVNRFFGTNRKAVTERYTASAANITIPCVDSIEARFEIAGILKNIANENTAHRVKLLYWLDFGNSRDTGLKKQANQIIIQTSLK